jgi:iron(III) transport system substrate-binding protein
MKFLRSPLLLRTVALAVSLVGASLAAPAQTPSADGIVVYNAQHASLTQAWADGFTSETGIKVTMRNGGDMELGNQLVQEGGVSPADVFLTENSPAIALVDGAGLFSPLDTATLAQVDANYRPSHGRWVGIAARSTMLVYKKTKFTPEQLPKSMMDLAEPAWKGRWAASPTGADFQAIVSALLELKGEPATLAWLKGMKANMVPYKGNGTAMKAVNAGQVDAALIYHYYHFADMAKTGENSEKTGRYYFRNEDPGAFISISGGGVLASSKHKAEAQAFVKWITGKGGQEILRTGTSFEYAVGVGAQSNRNLVPLADLHAPRIDPSKLNSKKVTDLMMQAGLL